MEKNLTTIQEIGFLLWHFFSLYKCLTYLGVGTNFDIALHNDIVFQPMFTPLLPLR